MTATASNPPGAQTRRSVAVLRGRCGSTYAFRLAGVVNEETAFRSATPSEFWSLVHATGMTLSLRWVVLPSSSMGPPGHIELYVFVLVPHTAPILDPDEWVTLLALGFPHHTFVPISQMAELIFALAPFHEWTWSLSLERIQPLRSSQGLMGFSQGGQSSPQASETLYHFIDRQADPAQAVFLLASCPVATALDWTLTPTELPELERIRWHRQAPRPDEEGSPTPLAFDCQVVWSGSAGLAPTILGPGVAQAFGAQDAVFRSFLRTPISLALSESDLVGDVGLRGKLLVAHGSLPHLMPTPDALKILAPSLRSPLRPRFPEVELAEAGAPLGRTVDRRVARLSVADRLRHIWILGQTGTGKSTLLLNRILQDMEDGHGLAVLDPHGDLVSDILQRLPASRRDDVILVDTANRQVPPPGLNLLECFDMPTAHMRAGQVVELISGLWPADFCGPIWQQATFHALLLLAARFEQPGTMADLPRLFLDEDFRKGWMSHPNLKDRVPQSMSWWTEGFAKYSTTTRAESLDYFISKFNLFFTDPTLLAILGQSRSTLDMRQLMDQRGVLLCNLSRGSVNPVATSLLTAVFMQCALNAALARSTSNQIERSPFFVYCDEFQRVVGPTTGAMLSEVRKYGLGLVLAHQFVDQLPEETLAAVLGNVGTKLIFRVGARDAQRIAGYQPALCVEELIGLPNFTACAELLVDGVPSPPFTLLTAPPPCLPSLPECYTALGVQA
jgi:hypothetical protein